MPGRRSSQQRSDGERTSAHSRKPIGRIRRLRGRSCSSAAPRSECGRVWQRRSPHTRSSTGDLVDRICRIRSRSRIALRRPISPSWCFSTRVTMTLRRARLRSRSSVTSRASWGESTLLCRIRALLTWRSNRARRVRRIWTVSGPPTTSFGSTRQETTGCYTLIHLHPCWPKMAGPGRTFTSRTHCILILGAMRFGLRYSRQFWTNTTRRELGANSANREGVFSLWAKAASFLSSSCLSCSLLVVPSIRS